MHDQGPAEAGSRPLLARVKLKGVRRGHFDPAMIWKVDACMSVCHRARPAPALARGELHLGRKRAGPAHERAGPRPGEPAGDPPASGAGVHDGVLFVLALAAAVGGGFPVGFAETRRARLRTGPVPSSGREPTRLIQGCIPMPIPGVHVGGTKRFLLVMADNNNDDRYCICFDR